MAIASRPADEYTIRSSGRQLLDEHFEVIQASIRSAAWTGRLRPDERGDFESCAWVKLLEDGQRRLGHYRGECPLAAFLKVTLRRILLDYRISRWGRWRPSVEAKRAGARAIDLERRVVRDGYPVHAVARSGSCEERRLLSLLQARPSTRTHGRRREEPLDTAVEIAVAPGPSPEEILLARAQQARRRSVGEALMAAIRTLSADERRLLAWRYEEGRTVSHIAVSAGRDQKRLYRCYERILRKLRLEIEGRGVAPVDIRDTMNAGVFAGRSVWQGQAGPRHQRLTTPSSAGPLACAW